MRPESKPDIVGEGAERNEDALTQPAPAKNLLGAERAHRGLIPDEADPFFHAA